MGLGHQSCTRGVVAHRSGSPRSHTCSVADIADFHESFPSLLLAVDGVNKLLPVGYHAQDCRKLKGLFKDEKQVKVWSDNKL